ncbi:uncharacterized protein LOC124927407 [Impatiens glandulifera]|uniref:uncharacterized protein LOC124927407 n=1 Tax=Impatiens glandulifera TaxID=253017 RepID=UPI001FB0EFDC|nr:uncharacterized protein LOC124927407 [Impatiens glandulifera]
MKYNEITHLSHPRHKLRLNYTNIPFKCNGCKEIGIGSHYNCSSSCDFDLHTHCAIPKPSISHPFYTECSFQFLSQPPGTIERNCNACEKRVTGFLYHCRKCGFDLHPCCARLPMVLVDDHQGKVKLNLFEKVSSKCQRCGKKGQSWSYRSSCNRYSLHVACVKEMLVERWHENEITRVPLNLKEILQIDHDKDDDDDDDDGNKKGKKKKKKGKNKFSEMAGIAFQFILSAILGDPTALIVGVVATLVSKS